jgi:signal transduction histidine kinase
MQEQHLDPRFMSIFRLYIALRLGFLALTGVLFYWEGGTLFTPSMAPYIALFLIDIAFLIVFLYWPWLQRHLGRMYLPLAITVASVIPISEANYLYALYGGFSIARLWVLFPFLSVPLILTAWQYRFRQVVWFCLGTGALELFLALGSERQPLAVLPELAMILTRTALFLLIGYIVALLVEEQRRQRQDLAEANRQLVLYASTLEQLTVSRERNRLARELHDTLAHTLSGLAVHLDALATLWQPEPPRAAAMLQQALQMTRDGLNETRRAMQALRATPLEELGLARAVRELAQQIAARDHLSLDMDIAEELGDVPPDVEQTFYRVAQEALENVSRHAQAQHVSLALRREGEALVLTINDDGRGFEPDLAPAERQYGLRGMTERAEMIHGELLMDSAEGQGARVTLRAPARPHPAEQA